MEGVKIRRDAPISLYPFLEFFQGFERVGVVVDIFGTRTRETLENLKVEFFSSRWGYMAVNDKDGHLLVSAHYLMEGDEKDIYLDIVHELVHVRQWQEGEELFPEGVGYHDRPTEVEAYRVAVEEARRIGLSEAEIREYLRVPWMDEEAHGKLLANLGIEIPAETP
ncbi:MAG: hypothetical protein ACE5LS_03560 [Thermoplasmata archaeon]